MAHTEFKITVNVALKDVQIAHATRHLQHLAKQLFSCLDFTIDTNVVPAKNTLVIQHDPEPNNPIDEQDTFTLFCSHRRYALGHKDAKEPFVYNEETARSELRDDIFAILPLYLYDHSGMTISVRPFGCPFDSGQVGWIYCTHDKNQWADVASCVDAMQRFIYQEYDQYLRGNTWQFLIKDENGIVVDSCSGFVGAELSNTGIKDYVPDTLHDQLDAAWENRFCAV